MYLFISRRQILNNLITVIAFGSSYSYFFQCSVLSLSMQIVITLQVRDNYTAIYVKVHL